MQNLPRARGDSKFQKVVYPFKKNVYVLDQLGYSCKNLILFELSIWVGGNDKDAFNSNVNCREEYRN